MTDRKLFALYGQVSYHWGGRLLTQKGQRAVVDATVNEWEAEKRERPNDEPREWIIKNRVKADEQVKAAIPLPLIIMVVGWIVQFILEYLKKDMKFSRENEFLRGTDQPPD